jgi:hypothetical protein
MKDALRNRGTISWYCTKVTLSKYFESSCNACHLACIHYNMEHQKKPSESILKVANRLVQKKIERLRLTSLTEAKIYEDILAKQKASTNMPNLVANNQNLKQKKILKPKAPEIKKHALSPMIEKARRPGNAKIFFDAIFPWIEQKNQFFRVNECKRAFRNDDGKYLGMKEKDFSKRIFDCAKQGILSFCKVQPTGSYCFYGLPKWVSSNGKIKVMHKNYLPAKDIRVDIKIKGLNIDELSWPYDK